MTEDDMPTGIDAFLDSLAGKVKLEKPLSIEDVNRIAAEGWAEAGMAGITVGPTVRPLSTQAEFLATLSGSSPVDTAADHRRRDLAPKGGELP
ncbi:hypothetical protein [Paraburkholderia sp. A1RO-1]|uniref:hypothetical protein n=1 Tax=unclassified Paraburkholderia TaxID=2615204 RepID=UPI003B7E8F3B